MHGYGRRCTCGTGTFAIERKSVSNAWPITAVGLRKAKGYTRAMLTRSSTLLGSIGAREACLSLARSCDQTPVPPIAQWRGLQNDPGKNCGSE